ncbi:hypothetical protein I552_8739 [Mycobacterium xenopi 3993]|nr:hypothetical protein I552_8739 [Mycobacterium xenopi 3993]
MTTPKKPGPPRGGPIQVGMVFGIAVKPFAVGGDHLQTQHALARRAEHRAVPAIPALQQIAAQANALAVSCGKEQPRESSSAANTLATLPGPTFAVICSVSTLQWSSRLTSSSKPPSRRWLADQLWPPERTPTRWPWARA